MSRTLDNIVRDTIGNQALQICELQRQIEERDERIAEYERRLGIVKATEKVVDKILKEKQENDSKQ